LTCEGIVNETQCSSSFEIKHKPLLCIWNDLSNKCVTDENDIEKNINSVDVVVLIIIISVLITIIIILLILIVLRKKLKLKKKIDTQQNEGNNKDNNKK
jgi:amino acid transporter